MPEPTALAQLAALPRGHKGGAELLELAALAAEEDPSVSLNWVRGTYKAATAKPDELRAWAAWWSREWPGEEIEMCRSDAYGAVLRGPSLLVAVARPEPEEEQP